MERQGGRWECSCHGSTCPHPVAVQAPSNIVDCNVTTLSNLLLAKMTKRRIELSVFVLRYFGEQQIPIRYTRDICFVRTSEPTRFAVWIQHIEIVCAWRLMCHSSRVCCCFQVRLRKCKGQVFEEHCKAVSN